MSKRSLKPSLFNRDLERIINNEESTLKSFDYLSQARKRSMNEPNNMDIKHNKQILKPLREKHSLNPK